MGRSELVELYELAPTQTEAECLVRIAQKFALTGRALDADRALSLVLREDSQDLPALINLAYFHRGSTAPNRFSDLLQRIRSSSRSKAALELGDSVRLVAVLATAGDGVAARTVLDRALRAADVYSIRRLGSDELLDLLFLSAQLDLRDLRPDLIALGYDLVPSHGMLRQLASALGQTSQPATGGHEP